MLTVGLPLKSTQKTMYQRKKIQSTTKSDKWCKLFVFKLKFIFIKDKRKYINKVQ